MAGGGAASEWLLVYLLVDPTTGPTRHPEGTVFHVGWLTDGPGEAGMPEALFDLGAPEAHEDVAHEGRDGVAERIEELRARGVAPLVRIVTFGGPRQPPGLNAEVAAGFCALLFGLRPATRVLDGYRYEFDDERTQPGQNARSSPVREWDVEDYVRVRLAETVRLPEDVAALIVPVRPIRDAPAILRATPSAVLAAYRELPGGSSWTSIADRVGRVFTGEVPWPVAVLVVGQRARGELMPPGWVLGVWRLAGLQSRDPNRTVLEVGPDDAEVVALRRHLVGRVLLLPDGRPAAPLRRRSVPTTLLW